ncbi:hypothetical protein D3C73_1647060 [compost metagenome]
MSQKSPLSRTPTWLPSTRMSCTPIVCISTVPPIAPDLVDGPLFTVRLLIRSGSI